MDSNKYTCNICNKSYKSYKSMWFHKKKIHENSKIIPQKTSTLSVNSTNITQKNDIITEEDNLLKCEYCNKTYSRTDNLKRHLIKCKIKEDIIKENEILKKQLNIMEKNNKDIRKLLKQFKMFMADRTICTCSCEDSYEDSCEELC